MTGKADAERAAVLEIEFSDGRLVVGGGPAKPARGRKAGGPDQGSLF